MLIFAPLYKMAFAPEASYGDFCRDFRFFRLWAHIYKIMWRSLFDRSYREMYPFKLTDPPKFANDIHMVRIRESWRESEGSDENCDMCAESCCAQLKCPMLDEKGRCLSYGSLYFSYLFCGRYPENQSQIDLYQCPKWEMRPDVPDVIKKTKNEIWVYNKGHYERERIVAEKWMRLIYDRPVVGATLLFFVKRKFFSRLYGIYCSTAFSARKIPKFIQENQIDMTGCEGPYKTFAEFFARERRGVVFPKEHGILFSPCEGLVSLRDDIDPKKMIAAKSHLISLDELFGDKELAEAYRGGLMIKIRLTPANYHRMHFFDDGIVNCSKFINGDLFSVSPLALRRIGQLYCRNKRALIQFSSKNFGDVTIVEVGATFVGSIVHCFKDGEPVSRGQQAGYFLPGGSLVLMFFKKGAFTPDETLIEQTIMGYETKVQLGEALGYA